MWDPDKELPKCSQKLDELEKDIRNFDVANAVNEKQRILSRLLHVIGRLQRLEP